MNKINDNLYTFEGQQDIVSPQLVYYPAIIRENIRKMIDIAGGAARLWPHIKTHKMAEVVQMQIEAGIDRFKCATIAEAEMAAKAGAKHLTLAYPLVGPNIKRFAALQAAFPEVEFFAIGDDTEQIRKLGQTCKANVLMDVDMGQHRTGVPLDKVEAMYREWNTLPGIVMRGMHCYDGHRHESSVQEREVATAPVDKQIEEIKARGGKIIAVIARGDEQVRRSADFVIEVPVIAECLMPIVVSVPLQLLAYYIAVYKGRNVDQPRNLAKSVTVE